ncbi:MAG: hypothetical protein HRU02_15885 [Myxococcales bacterium]|nr:hypothetical protein [Myxococcales bacterium]
MTLSAPALEAPAAIPPESLAVVPDAQAARRLARSYRELLLENLAHALDHAEAGLEVEVPSLRERIASLDPSRRFSPAIYLGFWQLSEAFRSGVSEQVVDALQWLCALTERDIFDSRFHIGSILGEWWEEPFVRELRKPPTDGHREGDVVLQPLLEADLTDFEEVHEDALRLIEEADEGMWGEITEYVSRLKLFVGQGIHAVSSPRVFGAVYLQLPPEPTPLGPYCLEHLVHEASHLALNALMAHDPLLENPEEVHAAPIRPDPRPLYQVLHGTFVLARNLRVYTRLAERRPEEFPLGEAFERSAEAYARGYGTLAAVAAWTTVGEALFSSFEAPGELA